MKKIFIIAGEASGDLNTSLILSKLKSKIEVEASGVGGLNLTNAGMKLLYHYKDVNYIGFAQVIKHYFKLKSILNDVSQHILSENPDIVMLVDFPGFNLRIAKEIRRKFKGKIIYYISPQIWAWHKSRINTIKENIDKMLVVFPFEKDFYKIEGFEAMFVGHPLVELLNDYNYQNSIKENKVLTLMPGSRAEEVERIFPVLAEAANILIKKHKIIVQVIVSPVLNKSFYTSIIPSSSNFNFIQNTSKNEAYSAILNSDAVICKSGTSTMECTIIGVPFCVIYKASAFNYFIGKRFIQVNHIAMPNILAGKEIVKEFIQEKAAPDSIVKEAESLLFNSLYRAKIMKNLNDVKNSLTGSKSSEKVSEILLSILKK